MGLALFGVEKAINNTWEKFEKKPNHIERGISDIYNMYFIPLSKKNPCVCAKLSLNMVKEKKNMATFDRAEQQSL